jgi:hypothetical protein
MSKTYRKNKGRNALQNYTNERYLLKEDEAHTKLHGEYHYRYWRTYDEVNPHWVEYKNPWWSIGWGARKFIPFEGKERKREWNKLHKDGTHTFTVGKYYKNKEWRKQRRHYKAELYKFKVREDYEVAYLPNPDSSWDAW